MRVREGGVELEVPEESGGGDGAGGAVFYNPDQELNRDVTVAVLRAYREREGRASSYLDATAATGVRGVRAAAEGWDVTCCDVDPEAVEYCRRNLALNGLDGEAVPRDANALMHESAFDVVDVDPFGTPIRFADAAFGCARDLACFTATDTAPLCGAHFESGVRKYGAVPRNTEYHAEMGLRVLVSALVRTAARYDVAAVPLLSHATRHYVRTYLELERGASAANAAIAELGYVHHCPECLHREAEAGLVADPPGACPGCGGDQVVTAGPIWLAAVREREFVGRVREQLSGEMGTARRARRLLDRLTAELDTPTHYDQHRLCGRWDRPAGPMDEFLERLRAVGFRASRTHYGGTTFKTDASVAQIRETTAIDDTDDGGADGT